MDTLDCTHIFKSISDKISLLTTHIAFIKTIKFNKTANLRIIKRIEAKISLMQSDLEELDGLLKKQKMLLEEAKVDEIEIAHLMYEMDQLIELNTMNEDFNNRIEYNSSSPKNTDFIEHSSENGTSECYELSPVESMQIPKISNYKAPKYITFDITYINEDEYKTVPKYMVGRLSLESINKFIDVINITLENKYAILSKPKSVLKLTELNLYKEFKQQECIELNKKRFISENDVARELKKCTIGKRDGEFLTILRHTRRVERKQIKSNVFYITTGFSDFEF